MKILAVKSNKIGSKIIRWGTEEPASHIVIEFPLSHVSYHSYIVGIEARWTAELKKEYATVGEISLTLPYEVEKKCLQIFRESIPKTPRYDYPAIIYFGWRALLNKTFKIPYPKLNDWQEDEGFLCTEIIYLLANALAVEAGIMILPDDHDLAITRPWEVINLIAERLKKCGASYSFTVF